MQFKLLAVGVAVAACFTSVTTPAYSSRVDDKYLFAEGDALTVNTQDEKIKRVIGGSDKSAAFKTGSLTVNTGNWEMIVGGSYAKGDQSDYVVGFESTSVTINSSKDKKVTALHVVGGTAASNANGVTSPADTKRTASLTINGGSYGTDEKWTADTLECLVVGGDHVKNFPSNENKPSLNNSSDLHLNNTATMIRDAEVNALVVGGSVANQYYANTASAVLKVNVGTANTTIVNSTVNRPIVAGGVAIGINAVSNVKEANLTIESSQINDTVFTGGVVRYVDTNGTIGAKVDKSNVIISNSVVKTIENGRGFAIAGNNKDKDWIFKPETGSALHDKANDVFTDLVLVNSTVETLNLSKGDLTLVVENAAVMSINDFNVDETVGIKAKADGATNDKVGGDINKFLQDHIKIENGATTDKIGDAKVELAEGEVIGTVTGSVVNGKLDESTVVEAVNQKSLDVTHMVGMLPRFVTRVEMNDLRKRMGDLRATEGQNGVWARYDGGKLSGLGLVHKFNKIQVGADTMPTNNGIRFGAAMSYTQGDVDGVVSTADMETYSLAGYGVWMGDQGQFVDVIARLAKVNTEVKTSAYTADVDQLAFSLSGEVGMRFDLAKRLYVEPSVEATYTYVDGDSFKGTTSHFELDSTHSFMTRAGAALGWKLPNDRGDVYVRGGLVHEFMGDSKLSVDHGFRTVEVDGKDTWFEYAIGGNYRVTDTTYVWADLERSATGDVDTDWRATVGARFVF